MLVSQDVVSSRRRLHCPDPPDINTILYPQPELPHKQGQVLREGVSGRVKLIADPLEEEVGFIAQQRVPVVAQVELSVPPSRVDLIDADELPVPGILVEEAAGS